MDSVFLETVRRLADLLEEYGLKRAKSPPYDAVENGWYLKLSLWRNRPSVFVFYDNTLQLGPRGFWFGFGGTKSQIDILIDSLPNSSFKKGTLRDSDFTNIQQLSKRLSDRLIWYYEHWPKYDDTHFFGFYEISLSDDQKRDLAVSAAQILGEIVTFLDPNLAERRDIADIQRRRPTDMEALILARRGQGRFRDDLLDIWKGCAVTGIRQTQVLRASHIKPWRESNDFERLDPNNGLLLNALLDALFDRGLISFNSEGKLLVSGTISIAERQRLQIDQDHFNLLLTLNDAQRAYLGDHRNRYGFSD